MAETYPPALHVLRDLRLETERPDADRSITWCPVVDELRDEAGSLRAGVIGTVIDAAGAGVAMSEALPDRVATVDLSYTTMTPLTCGPLVAVARLLRKGRTLLVVRVEVGDGEGSDEPDRARAAGVGLMTFAVIPNRPDHADISAAGLRTRPRASMALAGSGFEAPLADALGLVVRDARTGVVELARTDYVRNSFGTINGGVLTMVVEAAAQAASTAALGRPATVVDFQVHYLDQTRVGPARTTTTVLRASGTESVCEVRVVDAGHDDLLLAVATARANAI